MLKTASAAGPAVGDEQDGKGIQVENGDEKELTQKSRKSHMAKSKKWIQVEKSEAAKAKNLNSQSVLFLTPKAKKAFIKLRQAFVKALILNHFDPERHIRIETDVSGYTIGGILSQLTSDDSSRWHPVAFFLQEDDFSRNSV